MRLLSVFLLAPCLVWAGPRVGNGGKVLLCKDKPTEVYDYFEARDKRGFKLQVGSASQTADQNLQILLDRVAEVNPSRARLYRSWYSDFWKETNLKSGIKIIDVPDVGVGEVPNGCEVAQVAAQMEPVFAGDTRYLINKDIWDQMDTVQRAALVMHELILREAKLPENAHEDSYRTRYFNGLLAANMVSGITSKKYGELIRLLELRRFDAYGIEMVRTGVRSANRFEPFPEELFAFSGDELVRGISIGPFHYSKDENEVIYQVKDNELGALEFSNGRLTGLRAYGIGWFWTSEAEIRVSTKVGQDYWQNKLVKFVRFYDNGLLRSTNVVDPTYVMTPAGRALALKITESSGDLSFDQAGVAWSLLTSDTLPTPVQQYSEFLITGYTEFYANGRLKSAEVSARQPEVRLKAADGRTKLVKPGHYIRLNADGLLTN